MCIRDRYRHSVSFHCALPPSCDEMKKDTQRCLTAVQVVIDLGTVIACLLYTSSAHCRLQGFQTTFDLRSIRGLARLYH